MRKGSIALAVAALAVIAALVAGCGGDSDSSTTAEPLTKAEFTKQANAVCKEGKQTREERFAEEAPEEGQIGKSEKEDLVANAFAEPYGESIEGLKELGAPKGEEQKVEAIIAAMEKSLKELEAAPLKGLSSIEMFEDADKLVSEYGLDECIV